MADIEQSCMAADRLVLIDDAGILNGHLPPGKIDEFPLGFAVGIYQWRLFDRTCVKSLVKVHVSRTMNRFYRTSSNSTSNTNVALGGMTPPAPRVP